MTPMFSFTCADLDMTYEAVYQELAAILEVETTEAVKAFAPDDAVARVRYHRRQASRRTIQAQLATKLGIDASHVYAAVGEEGARILLEALEARETTSEPRWSITTHPAAPVAPELSELEDAMAR